MVEKYPRPFKASPRNVIGPLMWAFAEVFMEKMEEKKESLKYECHQRAHAKKAFGS